MVTPASRKAIVTLPSDTTLKIVREFDAPRHLVYRAYTTPEHVRRWWTAGRGAAQLVEIDLRPGGRWRYVMVTPGGQEVAFHGVYRQVVTDELLVSTEVFEGYPDEEAVTTTTFTGEGGRTVFTQLVEHPNRATRDAHLNAGMEGGLQDALDLLENEAAALG